MAYLDIVGDILQRVLERAGPVQASDLLEIEQAVRIDWGGQRHYVAKVGDAGRLELMKRDMAICAEAKNNVPEDYLSLKYNLGLRRIRQIISAGNALP